MAWHDATCTTLDLEWEDGQPRCRKCERKAPKLAPVHPISPPAPPPDTRRSELICTWPPGPLTSYHRDYDQDGKQTSASGHRWEHEESHLDGNKARRQRRLAFMYANIDVWTCGTITRQPQKFPDPVRHSEQQLKLAKLGKSKPVFQNIHPSLPYADSIRLLCLHGTKTATDPVHCTLLGQRLRDPCLPVFEALSYTWADSQGDSTLRETIFIGPHYDNLPVTSNCLAALRHYRTTVDRLIWVDAICIDQFDLGERGHQVSLMKEIYATASRVLMFVSDDAIGTVRAPSLAQDGHAALQSSCMDPRKILSMPYFSRVWIIQEVQLSRNAILTIGGRTLHWGDVLDQLHTMKQDEAQESSTWVEQLSIKKTDVSIKSLLEATVGSQCGDPRDRVYGLMGLAPADEQEHLPVDYSISVQQLYTGLAIYWLMHSDTRRLRFSILDLAMLPKITPYLPSWVPDWAPLPDIDSDHGRSSPIPVTFLLDNARTAKSSLGHNWFHSSHDVSITDGTPGWRIDGTFWEDIFCDRLVGRHSAQAVAGPLLRNGLLAVYSIHIFSILKGEVVFTDHSGNLLHGLKRVDSRTSNTQRERSQQTETQLHALIDWNGLCLLKLHTDRFYSLDSPCQIVCAPAGKQVSRNIANNLKDARNSMEATKIEIVESWLMDLYFFGVCAGPAYASSTRGPRFQRHWLRSSPLATATCEALNLSFKTPLRGQDQNSLMAAMTEIREEILSFVADKIPSQVSQRDSRSGVSQSFFRTTGTPETFFKAPQMLFSYSSSYGYSDQSQDRKFADRIQRTHVAKLPGSSSPQEMYNYLERVVKCHRDICQHYVPLKAALEDIDIDLTRIWTATWSDPSGLMFPFLDRIPQTDARGEEYRRPLHFLQIIHTALEHLRDLTIDPKFTLEQNFNILWICVSTMEMVARLRGMLQQELILSAVLYKMKRTQKIYLV